MKSGLATRAKAYQATFHSICTKRVCEILFKGFLRLEKFEKLTGDTSPDFTESGKKLRADALLLARGLACSRERARDLIIDGAVLAGGMPISKPSKLLAPDCDLVLTSSGNPWVSRAGLKLSGGLKAFPMIDVAGRYAIDIGASTGGFTDVLLAHNVGHVVAVDVGSGQIAKKIAIDPRVTLMETTNARHLVADMLEMPVELIVCDASFISLKKLLPAVMSLAAAGAFILALIKPQFEVGKGLVGKGGIVRNAKLHDAVIADIERWIVTEMKWQHLGTVPSPIDGLDGNREFLLAGRKT
jgi:23S rRNA (cytidine1920-2'-O)/16S rRNA (cytidine1409-2'-O)-methyltransferase